MWSSQQSGKLGVIVMNVLLAEIFIKKKKKKNDVPILQVGR